MCENESDIFIPRNLDSIRVKLHISELKYQCTSKLVPKTKCNNNRAGILVNGNTRTTNITSI